MAKRSYSGPAIDVTWQDFQDRPFVGNGETIEVVDVDDRPHNECGEVELPADYALSPKRFELFLALAEDGPMTKTQLADAVDMTHQGVTFAIEDLEEHGLVTTDGTAAYNADLYRLAVSPTDTFVFSDGISSDDLPSTTHPLRLQPKHREALVHGSRYPTKSKSRIAESLGVSHALVSRVFDEHGDPRREVNEYRVGKAESELEEVEERIEYLKERRTELIREIKAGGRRAPSGSGSESGSDSEVPADE